VSARLGKHVALVYTRGGAVGGRWGLGRDMDGKGRTGRWMKKTKDPGGEYVVDLVETFSVNLDMR